MEWISVKEKLPTPTTLDDAPTVLITDGKNISTGWYEHEPELEEDGRFFPEEKLWHDHGYWNDLGLGCLKKDMSNWPIVTHWMPLPEPPKGD